jgi:hypothetical protein
VEYKNQRPIFYKIASNRHKSLFRISVMRILVSLQMLSPYSSELITPVYDFTITETMADSITIGDEHSVIYCATATNLSAEWYGYYFCEPE